MKSHYLMYYQCITWTMQFKDLFTVFFISNLCRKYQICSYGIWLVEVSAWVHYFSEGKSVKNYRLGLKQQEKLCILIISDSMAQLLSWQRQHCRGEPVCSPEFHTQKELTIGQTHGSAPTNSFLNPITSCETKAAFPILKNPRNLRSFKICAHLRETKSHNILRDKSTPAGTLNLEPNNREL